MEYIMYSIFIFFILFNGIIPAQFKIPQWYNYWDEALCILIFCAFIIANIKKNKGKIIIAKTDYKFILPWLVLVLFGIAGNILYSYVEQLAAIVRDIIGCLKFALTFVAVRGIGLDYKIAWNLKQSRYTFLKMFIIVSFFCGVLSLFFDISMFQSYDVRHKIVPYQFLFSHPTMLVFVSVSLICLLNVKKKDNLYFGYIIMLVLTIIMCMRTKGFAFIACFVFIKYSSKWLKKWKILYCILIGIIIFAVSYSKLLLYSSYESSGREVLYIGSWLLIKKCFPIGSGFATYASHLSGKYNSPIYRFIYSSDFFNEYGQPTSVLGDTGIPYYVGQFGVIGIILIVVSIKYLLEICKKNNKQISNTAYIFLIYILIALTSESILINIGVEIAILLSVIIRLEQLNDKNDNLQEIL